MPAVLWFAAGILLVAAEILVGDFFLLMLGGGALAAALATALGAPTWVAAVVFALASVGLLVGVRPLLRRHLLRTPTVAMNADALVGLPAVVTVTVTDGDGGRVRLDGQEWTARTDEGAPSLPVGSEVVVERIDGATAVVGRRS